MIVYHIVTAGSGDGYYCGVCWQRARVWYRCLLDNHCLFVCDQCDVFYYKRLVEARLKALVYPEPPFDVT